MCLLSGYRTSNECPNNCPWGHTSTPRTKQSELRVSFWWSDGERSENETEAGVILADA